MPDDSSDIPASTALEGLPEHIARPHLRRILPQPVQQGQQQGVALRDPLGLAERTMVVAPPVMKALGHLNGEWTIEQIAQHGGAAPEQVLKLVQS